MRLIDADALSVEVDKSKHDNPHPQGFMRVNHRNEHDHFQRMIYDAPTIDAVEVVHCKDCKHTDTDGGGAIYCEKWDRWEMPEDFFCSYGERKDNG